MDGFDVIEMMKSRFKSLNEIPVERAHIKKEEWEILLAHIEDLYGYMPSS